MSGVRATRAQGRLRCRPDHARRGGQGGFTLLELLLVLAISGLLIGPVAAWTILVMRQNPVQRDGMVATAQADLVRAYFPEDVAVAGAADDYKGSQPAGGRWDTWRKECLSGHAATGRPLTVLITQAFEPVKVMYSVAPTLDGGNVVSGSASLWRSECKADTGELLTESQLIRNVIDDSSRTTATCSSPTLANGDPDKPCRQIQLRITTEERDGRIDLSATRRTDARSLEVDLTGNFLPTADIEVTAQEFIGNGNHTTRVSLSGAGSFDPEGTDLTYRWELPTGPVSSGAPVDTSQTGVTASVVLTEPGDYGIRLTVTDAKGASNTSYEKVTIVNRAPVASVSITPLSVVANDTLQLDASGSSDPDGSITSWSWRLTPGGGGPEVQTYNSRSASFVVPAWAIGNLIVELVLTDDRGAQATVTSAVQVLDPADPNPDPGPDPDPNPDPGAPVAVFFGSPSGGTSVALNASDSQGAIVSWNWDLGLGAGTASGVSVQPSFPGPGAYSVVLTVTDDQGRSASTTRLVIVPGQIAPPDNPRLSGSTLVWDVRPGARRYLVDMESNGNGCAHSVLNQVVAPSPSPSWPLLSAMCGAGGTAQVRVGAEGEAGSPVAWTGWIDVTGSTP